MAIYFFGKATVSPFAKETLTTTEWHNGILAPYLYLILNALNI
jgi:hypothetical protein